MFKKNCIIKFYMCIFIDDAHCFILGNIVYLIAALPTYNIHQLWLPFHKTYQNLLIVEQIGFVFTSCFNKIAQRDTLGFRYKTPQMRGFTALSQHHTPLGLTFFPQALRLVELTIGIYSINRMNAPLK